MYKSPIEIVQTEMQAQIENGIMKAVQDVGIHVDKDELLKALAYDREQYQKGYADGRKAGHEWISAKEPPEAYSLVNIYTTKKVVDSGYFDGVDWRQYNDEIAMQCTIGEVVMWAPTPEPPKEE